VALRGRDRGNIQQLRLAGAWKFLDKIKELPQLKMLDLTEAGPAVIIWEGAMWGHKALEIVVLGDGVVEIERGAFSRCSSLKVVKLGSGLTKMGESVFGDCSSLVEVVVPDGVKEIGNWAFMGCSSLETLSLGPMAARLSDRVKWGIPTTCRVIERK
jgi:hypothetical protein